MATPHINAEKGDFAKTVLMPGDPLRAKYISENFLTNAKQINSVRGMLGYTGIYNNKEISVMASGMGMPSMAIYSYELFKFYNVENIIRIGTAGAISYDLHLRDIVLGMASATNSNFALQYNLPGTPVPTASYKLLKKADNTANKLGIKVSIGNLLCSDVFYNDDTSALAKWQKIGILATEMESAALYFNALRLNKNALCICTISDCPLKNEECPAQEREKTFNDMIRIALECN